jgi:hypothetical protein
VVVDAVVEGHGGGALLHGPEANRLASDKESACLTSVRRMNLWTLMGGMVKGVASGGE